MSSKWESRLYSDKYHEALEKMIQKKIESGASPGEEEASY
jgi:non-homologous end joining protein Ku